MKYQPHFLKLCYGVELQSSMWFFLDEGERYVHEARRLKEAPVNVSLFNEQGKQGRSRYVLEMYTGHFVIERVSKDMTYDQWQRILEARLERAFKD